MYFYTALQHEFGRTAAEVANGVLFAPGLAACSLVSYMTLAGASEKSLCSARTGATQATSVTEADRVCSPARYPPAELS